MTYELAFSDEDPMFIIGVASRMLGVPSQTLRYYESIGLLHPERTEGNQRLYSYKDLDRVKKIRNLSEDLGINLAGVEVVLTLLQKIEYLEEKLRTQSPKKIS